MCSPLFIGLTPPLLSVLIFPSSGWPRTLYFHLQPHKSSATSLFVIYRLCWYTYANRHLYEEDFEVVFLRFGWDWCCSCIHMLNLKLAASSRKWARRRETRQTKECLSERCPDVFTPQFLSNVTLHAVLLSGFSVCFQPLCSAKLTG